MLAQSKQITSSLWQQQLQAMPGVIGIEAPYEAKC